MIKRHFGMAVLGLLALTTAVFADPPSQPASETAPPPQTTAAIARDRAKLLHEVYSTSLEVMHERYFHDERAIVPARALEDVFSTLEKQTKVKARWISVNTRPMSINHEPKTDFERKAAEELAAGKTEYEQVKDGLFQRATPIALSGGCVSCHTGFFASPPKSPRFAGLVISIPVDQE